MTTSSSLSDPETTSPKPMGRYWWIYLVQGIATIILGLLLIFWPMPTLILIVTFVGVYWLITGVFHVVTGIFGGKAEHRGWTIAGGLLGTAAGIVVLARPLAATLLVPTVLILVIGVLGILIGLLGIAQAIRGGGWAPGIWGIVSIGFALILFSYPLMAVNVLRLILGIFGILGGFALIAIAFRVRS